MSNLIYLFTLIWKTNDRSQANAINTNFNKAFDNDHVILLKKKLAAAGGRSDLLQ